ncbi:hypothetical protein [Bacillus sp. SG-1]|uniref:hypothetical protein n=1 Tax=Bacillus sp. SG-1 TaxID=161544 RepID=UPI00015443D5|nr:hypothetical protein [Bacillus sp. SG-1]EDL64896.1 hypothetical protein BSG1_20260 [Bacillus sp. SG-1]
MDLNYQPDLNGYITEFLMYSPDNYQETMSFYFFSEDSEKVEEYYTLESPLAPSETQIITFEFHEFTVMLYPVDLSSNHVRFFILDIEEL